VTQLEPTDEPSSSGRPTRLTGSAAFRLHATLALGLGICIGAFCTEVIRALDGNALSWLYVFEWPFFAGFGIYMWWQLLNGWDRVRPAAKRGGITRRERQGGAGEKAKDDKALSAWNRYLREMNDAELKEEDQAISGSDPAECPLERS
jgi:hypothetical protein